jgi:hypothetical protein
MFWQIITGAASVVTIVGLPYLVVSYRKRVPRFSFGFSGSAKSELKRDGLDMGRLQFQGSVRNQSLDPNSIEQIRLVIWKTKCRRGTHTFGYVPLEITENGIAQHLPLSFSARESKTLTLVYEIPLTGTHEAELFRALQPVAPDIPGAPLGATLYLPKYQYELAFKDVLGNLFDQDGLLRNEKGIGLRWTLENTFRQLKDGHPLPYARHLVSIFATDVVFFVRRNLRRMGL